MAEKSGGARNLKNYQKISPYTSFSYITSQAWSSHSVWMYLPTFPVFSQEMRSTRGSYPRGLVTATIMGQCGLLLNEKLRALVGRKALTNVCVLSQQASVSCMTCTCFAELYTWFGIFLGEFCATYQLERKWEVVGVASKLQCVLSLWSTNKHSCCFFVWFKVMLCNSDSYLLLELMYESKSRQPWFIPQSCHLRHWN